MSVTVTIHKGELAQIKRLIGEEKVKKGQLYGLWTHSFQPVIQYVIGEPKSGDGTKIEECLQEQHFLQHVGNWSTLGDGVNLSSKKSGKAPPSFVKMGVELVDNETINVKPCVFQENSNYEKELDALIEELEGDSAFRLIKTGPFGNWESSLSERYHHEKVKDANNLKVIKQTTKPANEAETKDTQWYSTEDGMKLFGLIHGVFQKQFEITGTSRDKKTHDISITLKSGRKEFIVDFPSDFPSGRAIINDGREKREISLRENATEGIGKSKKESQNQAKKAKRNKVLKKTEEKGTTSKQVAVKKTEEKRTTSRQVAVAPNEEAPAEEAPNENENDNASAGEPEGAVQKEAEPSKQPSLEEIPELLVKGIRQILQGSEV